jgi:hypothetical protein
MSKNKKPSQNGLTKQEEKKLDQLVAANEARRNLEQEQLCAFRPLVMCGIPLRKLKEPYYVRKSGPYTVELISSPLGVPYGQDRLIPIFIATYFMALGCPEDNTIRFLYARDILRLFDLPEDGKTYQRLKEGFNRWRKTLISLEKTSLNKRGRECTSFEGISLIPEGHLWADDNADKEDIPNTLVLSARWADEIRKHPIPVDLQTIKALAHCPGALDFYLWQAWRSYSITEEVHVPLGGPSGILAQFGFVAGQPVREIRRLLKRWQKLIKICWPACTNSLGTDGKSFVLRPCRALGPLESNRFLLQVIQEYRKLNPR